MEEMSATKLEECARAAFIQYAAKFKHWKPDWDLDFDMGPMAKDDFRDHARAVIRCLMEPDEAMLHAATMEIPTWDYDASKRKMRAMLQTVLDGKE